MLETDFARLTKRPEADRRFSARLPCPHLSPVRLILLPGLPPVWGYTWDASGAALGLLLARLFPPGTVLEMELGRGEARASAPLTARVVHATPLPVGGWRIGCHLSRPLRDDEL